MTGLLVFIASFALSALLAVGLFLLMKAVRRRDERRSPLHGKRLHHVAGQGLIDRIAGHRDEQISGVTIMYFSFPIALLAWAAARLPWGAIRLSWVDSAFVVMGLLMFGWGLRDFIRHSKARIHAEDGLIAERMTAQQLNRLSGPRCTVLHDLPCEHNGKRFNIDHVVIAPRGVYMVETKSFRKRSSSKDESHYRLTYDDNALLMPGWRDEKPIVQAKWQAQWLARRLRDSLGRDVPVFPVVSVPGWYATKADPKIRYEVYVFSPMRAGAEFMAKPPDVLDASQRALIVEALAMQFPNISD